MAFRDFNLAFVKQALMCIYNNIYIYVHKIGYVH